MYQKDIIINIKWGGLGDSLQFSTLPEEYSKKKKNFLYIENLILEIMKFMI